MEINELKTEIEKLRKDNKMLKDFIKSDGCEITIANDEIQDICDRLNSYFQICPLEEKFWVLTEGYKYLNTLLNNKGNKEFTLTELA